MESDNQGSVSEDLRLLQRIVRVSRLLGTTQDSQDDPGLLSTLQSLINNASGAGVKPLTAADPSASGDDSYQVQEDVDDEDSNDEDDLNDSITIGEDSLPDKPPSSGNSSDAGTSHKKRKTSITVFPRPHAAVEKNYRCAVKAKIDVLQARVPASGMFSLEAPQTPRSGSKNGKQLKDGTPLKPEPKAVVLDRTIRYLNHLLVTYEQYEKEHMMYRQQLQQYCSKP